MLNNICRGVGVSCTMHKFYSMLTKVKADQEGSEKRRGDCGEPWCGSGWRSFPVDGSWSGKRGRDFWTCLGWWEMEDGGWGRCRGPRELFSQGLEQCRGGSTRPREWFPSPMWKRKLVVVIAYISHSLMCDISWLPRHSVSFRLSPLSIALWRLRSLFPIDVPFALAFHSGNIYCYGVRRIHYSVAQMIYQRWVLVIVVSFLLIGIHNHKPLFKTEDGCRYLQRWTTIDQPGLWHVLDMIITIFGFPVLIFPCVIVDVSSGASSSYRRSNIRRSNGSFVTLCTHLSRWSESCRVYGEAVSF